LFGCGRKIVNITGAQRGEGNIGTLERLVHGDPELAFSTEMPGIAASKLYSDCAFGEENSKLLYGNEPIAISQLNKVCFNDVVPIPYILVSQEDTIGSDFQPKTVERITGYFRRFFRFRFEGEVTERDDTLRDLCSKQRGAYGLFTVHKYMEMRKKWSHTHNIPWHQEYMSRMLKRHHPFGEFLQWSAEVAACEEAAPRTSGYIMESKGEYINMSQFLQAYRVYRSMRFKHSPDPLSHIKKTHEFLHEARVIEMFGYKVLHQQTHACYSCYKQQTLVPTGECTIDHPKTHKGFEKSLYPGCILNTCLVIQD
jgi:hypothetical protein